MARPGNGKKGGNGAANLAARAGAGGAAGATGRNSANLNPSSHIIAGGTGAARGAPKATASRIGVRGSNGMTDIQKAARRRLNQD